MRTRAGCMLALICYLVLLVPGYFLTLPAPVTSDFTGRNARLFLVAGVHGSGTEAPTFSLLSLAEVNEGGAAERQVGFLLPERDITIVDGDISRASVVETQADWQVIELRYSNTHTSTSRYRAYADRVEPLHYQMTSNIGHGLVAIVLILPAYLLALLVQYLRRRRDASSEPSA